MRRRSSPLFALACAFFLLFAQGAAFAHWIGHIAADLGVQYVLNTPVQEAESGESGESGELAEQHEGADGLCLSCLSYAGLFAAPPLVMAPPSVPVVTSSLFCEAIVASIVSRPVLPYGARAPPVVIS